MPSPKSSRYKPETLIALDLATKCGYAVLRGRKRIDSGRWNLLPTGVHRSARWLNLEDNLNELIAEWRPAAIGYERVRRHLGTTAAHVYGGLLATLERVDGATETHIDFVPLEVSTWRKAACGRGNVDKLYVEKWVKTRFKYTAHTDDEAEALAMTEALRRIRSGEYKL